MTEQTFLLPDLGEGLTDAEIVRWLVAEGDEVTVDQVVVEVETAKSLVDVPTPYAGRVSRLHSGEGQSVDGGAPLISVSAGSALPAGDPVAETYREEERAGSGNVLIGYGTTEAATTGRRRRRRPTPGSAPVQQAPPPVVPLVVSPLVRRLARTQGVDLVAVARELGGQVITRAHVTAAARPATVAPTPSAPTLPSPPPPAAVPGERRTPLSGFRRTVAAALTRSRSEIPEATVWVDVDATRLVALREAGRREGVPGPGLLAFLARFTVAALREHAVLNSRLDTERQEIVELDRIDLGLAVQGDRGLVVPAVRDAGSMTTQELDLAIRDVTGRARVGRTTPEENAGGTFTLNNYGGFRVDGSAAIITHPQVASLGFGRVLDRPWVVDGEIAVRAITQMSFVFDHRVCDGGTAAAFMRSVADAIEDPASAIARL